MNVTQIGHWAFVGGVALSVVAGFVTWPYVPAIVFGLGLIIGFLNIVEKESTSFLVATIALLVIGVAGLQAAATSLPVGTLTEVLTSVLNNFTAFVAAAGIVVAVKQVIATAETNR